MHDATATVDFKVRVISPWPKNLQIGSILFDSKLKSQEADALLCYWAPHNDLFDFDGPKAWYCCEPECQFSAIEYGKWPKIRARLESHQFLFHNHQDKSYRVPHITHYQDIEVQTSNKRLHRAIAVISNFGGGPRRRHPEIAYRNRFATNDLVDLYGRTSWQKYRKGVFSFPHAPGNYKGVIPGDWPASEKRATLSKYKACLCLENMTEPNYFTEKFVEAVCAGCIPIYRAHESLRSKVLSGAKWVDPVDYGDDPKRTIEAALEMDPDEFRHVNAQWIKTEKLAETHHSKVFGKIGEILFEHF